MKLSMYMLENWFRKEQTVSVITEGRRNISGARLFEDEKVPNPDYLYVGKTVDFFPESRSSKVMLMHHDDMITLDCEDLGYIFNRVLAAFEYYEELQDKFHTAYYQDAPEQAIISAVEDLIGPTFIMKTDYRILACSQNYSDRYVNDFWQSFVQEGEPTLQAINVMKSSVFNQLMRERHSLRTFREANAAPYEYAIGGSYTRYDGSLIGFLTVASDKPITHFEKDIAEIVMLALENLQISVGRPEDKGDYFADEEALFAEILADGDRLRPRDILTALYEFRPGTVFHIVVMVDQDRQISQVLRNKLKNNFRTMLLTQSEEEYIMLFWNIGQDAQTALLWELENFTSGTSIRAGISNPFDKLEDCLSALDQARFSLHDAEQGNVCAFSDNVLSYLLSDRNISLKQKARHPAVIFLEIFDRDNQTELTATLKSYLLFERSVKKTAYQLYIHKNTVLYRINQIRQMCGLDLDDDNVRIYLMISLLIS